MSASQLEMNAYVAASMQALREELRMHVISGTGKAGFGQDRGAQALACMMTLIGAAQLIGHEAGLDEVFASLCADMATGTLTALNGGRTK